jgi:TRAP-type C4-dicarboxylate transport system substrate-binding protein
MPADSVEGELFQMFADLVAEKTDGDITVNVFPSEQLGQDDTILEQLQFGTVHLYLEGFTYLQKWVDDVKWSSAPFLFDDREHYARFMQSDVVEGWLEQIEEEANITVIGDVAAFVRGPYRVMVSERDWETLEEMQGIRIRMHPDELAANAWTHLGAEVRTLGWTEVYEAIDRGIVEAVNSPMALVEAMRFYEVAPHIVRHDEYPQGMTFMVNSDAWNSLSEENRQAIIEAHEETAAASVARTDAIVEESLERMQQEGVEYTEIDTTAFVERMRSFYDEAAESGEMPADFLEAVNATREDS